LKSILNVYSTSFQNVDELTRLIERTWTVTTESKDDVCDKVSHFLQLLYQPAILSHKNNEHLFQQYFSTVIKMAEKVKGIVPVMAHILVEFWKQDGTDLFLFLFLTAID